MVISKKLFCEQHVRVFAGSGLDTVAGFCEYGSESSASIEGEQFLP
jgi:hypothetical protein